MEDSCGIRTGCMIILLICWIQMFCSYKPGHLGSNAHLRCLHSQLLIGSCSQIRDTKT